MLPIALPPPNSWEIWGLCLCPYSVLLCHQPCPMKGQWPVLVLSFENQEGKAYSMSLPLFSRANRMPCIFKMLNICLLGLPQCLNGKESTCNAGATEDSRFGPWGRKIPWSRAWQPPPVFLPGESHGHRSLVGYSPQRCKELDTTEAP